ncbi:C40 family peptidase [Yinghuangia aomiensis]
MTVGARVLRRTRRIRRRARIAVVCLTMALSMTVVSGCSAWQARDLASLGLDLALDYLGLNDKAKKQLTNPDVLAAISNAARRFPCEGIVSEPLLAGIVWIESGGNVNTKDSPVGAVGVAQFMPNTWNGVGQQAAKVDGDGDGDMDIKDPFDAIAATAKYLCTLRDEVKRANIPGDLLRNTVGAYNTGVPNVKRAGGVDNISGVKKYVDNVLAKRDDWALDVSGPEVDARAASFGLEIVRQARTQLGKPYVWAAGNTSGPTHGGFDCSGLVIFAVYQARVTFKIKPNAGLPHNTGQQLNAVKAPQAHIVPSLDAMVPGDAIYMHEAGAAAGDQYWHHVAIFTGKVGKDYGIVEAPRPGRNVRDQTLLSQYRERHSRS